MKRSRCRSCGLPIWWAETTGGKQMPLDLEPDPERGNVVLAGDPPLALIVSGLGDESRDAARRHHVPLYLSHFARCPHAAEWRRE